MRIRPIKFSALFVIIPIVIASITISACSDMMKIAGKRDFSILLFLKSGPVLNLLSISAYDSGSIILDRPTLATTGDSTATLQAYLGLDGKISVAGSAVSNYIAGPVDVSTGGNLFSGLVPRKKYQIVVVAQSSSGYDVKFIIQRIRGTGMWTWVSGDNSMNQSGVYGTKGVAADANKPGGRWQLSSWIDLSGNLWLFGGMGYDSTGLSSYLNDLWKFDGTRWTWVSGDTTGNQAGVYGTRGVAADANKPGARYRQVSWTDSSGNFLFFGGDYSNAPLSDQWKFDGARWTWVSGDTIPGVSGVYGTKGVAADTNNPGGHKSSVSWTDASGNRWLFGGGWPGSQNDLWKFDGVRWTWVSGDNSAGQCGVYGTKGVSADANKPGGRGAPISWIDASGNLWLFGGNGSGSTASPVGGLNDLWKFDGVRWTWVSGDTSINQFGVYGTKGAAADANKPGSRWGSVSWIDSAGDLWLFGGVGYDASLNYIFFNDLWKFDGVRWTWVSGDNTVNQTGVYGVKGVAAGSNKPGGHAHSISWIDADGNFWLFGGATFLPANGFYNDLWMYSPE